MAVYTANSIQHRVPGVLPALGLSGVKLFAVYPPALTDVPKVRAFVAGLVAHFGEGTEEAPRLASDTSGMAREEGSGEAVDG